MNERYKLYYKILKIFFSIFVFFYEQTTVLAQSNSENDQYNCKSQCLLNTLEMPKDISKWGIQLGKNSVVYIENEKQMILLKGSVFATKKGQIIKSEYGSILIEDFDSEVLIVRKSNRIDISVLKGSAMISKRRSQLGEMKIQQGMSVWFGPITTDGYSSEGIPQAIKLAKIQKDLMNTLPKKSYDQRLKDIRHEQVRWIAAVSDIYFEINKQIEDQRSAERAAMESKEKTEQDIRNHARHLFRQKYLSSPEDLGPAQK
jgi:hypothetical protein